MEIYLIRHTSPAIENGICYGQSDLPLAKAYQQEIARTLSILPKTFDHVYSSPLLRCRTLAYELSEDHTVDQRILELNFGDWELSPWNDIPKDQLNPWMKNYEEVPPPNGETYSQLHERTGLFWAEMLNQSKPNQSIAIISHAGVIRSILSRVLGLELKNSFTLDISYGSVTKILMNPHYQIQFINQT